MASRANPDGSPKEPGQQYEEISEAQDNARADGRPNDIHNKDRSKQGDKAELADAARNAGEDCPEDQLDDIWDNSPEDSAAWEDYKNRNKSVPITPLPSPGRVSTSPWWKPIAVGGAAVLVGAAVLSPFEGPLADFGAIGLFGVAQGL